MASTTAISSLCLELDIGSVTTEAHLLPPGPFRSEDGRPVECAAWQLDAAIAQRVIARHASQKNDTVIDYEHQSLRARVNGKPVIAAGWIKPGALEWREGVGLFATGISWVDDAAKRIAKKKIRYISAVFSYEQVTGVIVEIISVTLTNTPGIDGLQPLADLTMKFLTHHQQEDDDMPDENKQQIAALTTERNTLQTSVADLTTQLGTANAKVAALTTERDGLATQVAALTKEKADAAAAAEKKQHAELLQAALTAGRITPALKDWASKQSLAALTEYLEQSNPLAMLTKQHDGKDATATAALTKEEMDMCERMNIKPEDYAKTKAGK